MAPIMEWIRTSNREWYSTCRRYRIDAAVQLDESFSYAAMFVHGPKKYEGLGIYNTPDSLNNATLARQACEQHARVKTND